MGVRSLSLARLSGVSLKGSKFDEEPLSEVDGKTTAGLLIL